MNTIWYSYLFQNHYSSQHWLLSSTKVVLITINSMESDALIGPMKKTNEICICIVCSGPMRASDSY